MKKPLKPRDTIRQLNKPSTQTNTQEMETRYTSDSQDMANIGRDYHSHLQSICQSVSEKDRNDKIRAAVESIKTEVTHEQARILGQLLSRDDV